MPYRLQGRLLEVCDCRVLCPCWLGEDPDHGTCDTVTVYHIEAGTIGSVDVAGLDVAMVAHAPGNMWAGGWSVAVYISEQATEDQYQALVQAMTGAGDGPWRAAARLIGDIASIQRAPIRVTFDGADGSFTIGSAVSVQTEAFRSPRGVPTTLRDSVVTTTGSAVTVGRSVRYELDEPSLGIHLKTRDSNAYAGSFLFECR